VLLEGSLRSQEVYLETITAEQQVFIVVEEEDRFSRGVLLSVVVVVERST